MEGSASRWCGGSGRVAECEPWEYYRRSRCLLALRTQRAARCVTKYDTLLSAICGSRCSYLHTVHWNEAPFPPVFHYGLLPMLLPFWLPLPLIFHLCTPTSRSLGLPSQQLRETPPDLMRALDTVTRITFYGNTATQELILHFNARPHWHQPWHRIHPIDHEATLPIRGVMSLVLVMKFQYGANNVLGFPCWLMRFPDLVRFYATIWCL